MFEKVVSRTDPLPVVESQVVTYLQARIPIIKEENKPPVADSIVLVLNGKALDPDCPGLNPGSTAYRLYDMDDRASGSLTPGCLIRVPASK